MDKQELIHLESLIKITIEFLKENKEIEESIKNSERIALNDNSNVTKPYIKLSDENLMVYLDNGKTVHPSSIHKSKEVHKNALIIITDELDKILRENVPEERLKNLPMKDQSHLR